MSAIRTLGITSAMVLLLALTTAAQPATPSVGPRTGTLVIGGDVATPRPALRESMDRRCPLNARFA